MGLTRYLRKEDREDFTRSDRKLYLGFLDVIKSNIRRGQAVISAKDLEYLTKLSRETIDWELDPEFAVVLNYKVVSNREFRREFLEHVDSYEEYPMDITFGQFGVAGGRRKFLEALQYVKTIEELLDEAEELDTYMSNKRVWLNSTTEFNKVYANLTVPETVFRKNTPVRDRLEGFLPMSLKPEREYPTIPAVDTSYTPTPHINIKVK